mmetsp:Transcript_4978/g.12169  ORF Transcript_4978/g.12169 Transcript_4978/m.12169 type:complete len:213 (-) Transcript_4978:1744-2382(-)
MLTIVLETSSHVLGRNLPPMRLTHTLVDGRVSKMIPKHLLLRTKLPLEFIHLLRELLTGNSRVLNRNNLLHSLLTYFSETLPHHSPALCPRRSKLRKSSIHTLLPASSKLQNEHQLTITQHIHQQVSFSLANKSKTFQDCGGPCVSTQYVRNHLVSLLGAEKPQSSPKKWGKTLRDNAAALVLGSEPICQIKGPSLCIWSQSQLSAEGSFIQ